MAGLWWTIHDLTSRDRKQIAFAVAWAAGCNFALTGMSRAIETPFHGNGAAAVVAAVLAYIFGATAASLGLVCFFASSHIAWVANGDFSIFSDAGKTKSLIYVIAVATVIWLADRARAFIDSAKTSRAIVEVEREILWLIATNTTLPGILTELALGLEKLIPGVRCSVLALQADGLRLSTAAAPSLPNDYVAVLQGLSVGPASCSCGAATYLGQCVFSNDIERDPNWDSVREIALRNGLRAAWSFPIRGSGGATLGSFCAYTAAPGGPSQALRKIFESAAYLAGIAMERKRAERDIQQKRRFVEAMLESVQVGMAACNSLGDVTLYNNALKTILGVASLTANVSEWSKQFRLYFPNSAAPILDSESPIARAFKGEMLDNLEIVVEPRNEARRTVLLNSRPILDSAGKRLGAVVSLGDVTDRKRADALLRESEDRYRSLVETTDDFVFAITATGELTYSNRAVEDILGYTVAETNGLNAFTMIHVDEREGAKSTLAMRVAEKRGWKNLTARYRHKNGAYRYLESAGTPILGESGEVVGFRGVNRDVTERVEATESLRRSSERYQLLFDQIPQPAWVHDRESLRFLGVNRATEETYGYSREQLLAMTFLDILAPGEEVGLDSGDIGNNPSRVWIQHRADGSEFEVELKGYAIELEGAPAELILANDVTERRKLRRELEAALNHSLEATRAKDQFLARLNHEIRTPLSAAIGVVHLLERTALNSEQKQLCSAARASTEHLRGLIGDVLDLSEIESGKRELSAADFDPGLVVEEVADLLGEEAYRKGVQLVALAPALPMLRGDAGRLRQVLLNLTQNAVRNTNEGSIIVRAAVSSQDETELKLRVEIQTAGPVIAPIQRPDRNPGLEFGMTISTELVRQLGGEIGAGWFTARFQPSSTRAAAHAPLRNPVYLCCPGEPLRRTLEQTLESWGLSVHSVMNANDVDRTPSGRATLSALLICLPGDDAEAIEQITALRRVYDGEIYALTGDLGPEARERAILRGCDGSLAIPFRQGALRRLLEVPVAQADGDGGDTRIRRRGRVLVAEDNAVNSFVTSRILIQLGYSVEVAPNGRAAIAAFEAGRFDLILMDCEMPEMDGFEAAAAIRAQSAERIPIIALTAHAIKGYKERCLAAGMDGYLSKPIQLSDLSNTLERWISRADAPGALSHGIAEITDSPAAV